jgi:aminoglycoside phosphotransferase family enzyme/predicted kinase
VGLSERRWVDNFRDYLQAGQATPVRLLETHISWVLLSHSFAYKIKKPVNFGFLDFSDLEQRRLFCEAEVTLNRRLAPAIYLGAVPLYGSAAAPTLSLPDAAMDDGGNRCEPFEYAVKMNLFDPDQLLLHWLEQDRDPASLSAAMDALGYQIADFHEHADTADASSDHASSDYGSVAAVWYPVEQNFSHIEPLLTDPADLAQLALLRAWLSASHQRLAGIFEQRVAQGYIRACHGDLHSGNIAMIDDKPVPFDCIEFNESLRFIDVASDIAFLTMDLFHHNRMDLANRFLNRYLEYSGDYTLVSVLNYYQVYRAMVRAKVSILRLQQLAASDDSAGDSEEVLEDYRRHIRLAASFTVARQPFLVIMNGLSGSGKSTIARQICAAIGALHLQSDVERKRLFGLKPLQSSDSRLEGGIYTQDASRRTFDRLLQLAIQILQAGTSVVVDATFLHAFARRPFMELAQQRKLPFAIVACQLGEEQLEQRLRVRTQRGGEASEADIDVMRQQRLQREPFTQAEKPLVIALDIDAINASAGDALPVELKIFLADNGAK